MSENVELSSLDLRYENPRRRDDGCEARWLTSIARRGIETPLEGVDPPQGRFLLNGFKRYRCAQTWGPTSITRFRRRASNATVSCVNFSP